MILPNDEISINKNFLLTHSISNFAVLFLYKVSDIYSFYRIHLLLSDILQVAFLLLMVHKDDL